MKPNVPRTTPLVFKCSCMPAEVTIYPRARHDAEDVVLYMHGVVTPAIAAHHAQLSPHCRSTKCEYVKILIGGKNKDVIGGAPTLS